MLEKNEITREKITGKSEIIDYWINVRQELIIDYSKIAGLTDNNKNCLPTDEKLNRFCETLVDYISAGHFRIYNMVKKHWDSTGFLTTDEINALYFGILETTDPLLTFSEKYSPSTIDTVNFAKFDENISRVGEIMALRFEKEDILMNLILHSLTTQPNIPVT